MPARPAGCVQVPTCVLPLPWNFDPGVASAIATMEPHLQVDPPSSLGVDMSFTGSVGSLPPSQQRRREGRLTAVAVQGQPLAHWPGTHYRPNFWGCWQVQARGPGGGQRLHSHRSSCWGDGNFLPSLTISIVKNHLVKSHSAYTGFPSSPTTTTKPSPTRPACPPPPPLAMCHSEPL